MIIKKFFYTERHMCALIGISVRERAGRRPWRNERRYAVWGLHERDRLFTLIEEKGYLLWSTQIGSAGFEPGEHTWLALQSGDLRSRHTALSAMFYWDSGDKKVSFLNKSK